MTREEIVQWTREAGGFDATPEFLERFAALVAEKTAKDFEPLFASMRAASDGLAQSAAKIAAFEREECAKLCEQRYMGDNTREDQEALACAAAIRARGEK